MKIDGELYSWLSKLSITQGELVKLILEYGKNMGVPINLKEVPCKFSDDEEWANDPFSEQGWSGTSGSI